ncbi:cation diffusion facilitator family transporter [Ruminococcus sp.]|uniref:cation diffusion facilitator family transporter n=1 Tax=Ruminococcus sp. TaxID=41978 RepID=UPI001B5D0E72|nr:cation diffusion facilitator family transporter [Ruminococcus sp.]MBP5433513.1 cation transporter [Ruminococcus sp.]
MQYSEAEKRSKIIVHTSVIGILANVFLAAFKAVIGIISHSIAITLDAVNNLSDALSSVITIIGTKLAGRESDKKHPFGYGRIEYLSSLIIAAIVLYAGLTSLVESIKKIVNPSTPEYSAISLIIVGVAVLVKIVLGLYVKKTGEKVNSDSLVNSGKDALLDSVISSATLVAALIYVFSGFSLEAFLGAVISVVIIKAGFEMLSETVSKLLGEPGDVELIKDIKKTVCTFPEVKGAYDLILHNYGPDKYNGSIHIELEDSCSVSRLDELTREIMIDVYKKHQVILTAVGVYSINTQDTEAAKFRKEISERVLSHEYAKQVHGFYYNKSEKAVRFDVVISFDADSRQAVLEDIRKDLSQEYPEYNFSMAMDMDYGEI